MDLSKPVRCAAQILVVSALTLAVLAHAALNAYRVQDGQGRQYNAEVVGDQMYLFEYGGKKRVLAPDGNYTLGDGSVRQVRNGMLVPAVRGVQTPGAAQALNPQPLPPGRQGIYGKQSDESPKE